MRASFIRRAAAVTLSAVQRLVAVGMFMIGSGLMLGWL